MIQITRGIDHVGLTVPDIEAATRFFVQAFDARILYDTHPANSPAQTGPAAEAMLGLSPSDAVVAIRLLHLSNGPSIELFEARTDHQAQPAGVADLGLHHFALYCDDVERARARATAAGATALQGPNDLSGPEAGAANTMNYIRTPWGMLIELIAYPAGVDRSSGMDRWRPAADG